MLSDLMCKKQAYMAGLIDGAYLDSYSRCNRINVIYENPGYRMCGNPASFHDFYNCIKKIGARYSYLGVYEGVYGLVHCGKVYEYYGEKVYNDGLQVKMWKKYRFQDKELHSIYSVLFDYTKYETTRHGFTRMQFRGKMVEESAVQSYAYTNIFTMTLTGDLFTLYTNLVEGKQMSSHFLFTANVSQMNAIFKSSVTKAPIYVYWNTLGQCYDDPICKYDGTDIYYLDKKFKDDNDLYITETIMWHKCTDPRKMKFLIFSFFFKETLTEYMHYGTIDTAYVLDMKTKLQKNKKYDIKITLMH
jgi:hypothetical protein